MNQIEDSDLSGDSEKSENLLRFSELREETHKTMQVSIDERLRNNPVPSETELVLGAFTEELEPQVKDAVLSFIGKGYSTNSSGFYGEYGEYQCIDGFFRLNDGAKELLKDIGVTVEESRNGYTMVKFYPEKADLALIKNKWDQIAGIIPPTSKPAALPLDGGSQDFRKKYGDPDTVERIYIERRLARGEYPEDEKEELEMRLTELNKKQ